MPITRYCDDNQLTPRERLELFVPVCHETLILLGTVLERLSRTEKREATFRQAAALGEQLVRDYPTSDYYANVLRWAYVHLGLVLEETDRAAEAAQAFRKAMPLLERLAAAGNHDEAAVNYSRLTGLLLKLQRPDEAEQVVRRAIGFFEQMSAKTPGVPAYYQIVGEMQMELAAVLAAGGRDRAADEARGRAVTVFEELATTQPGNAKVPQVLGSLYAERGQWTRAVAEFTRALDSAPQDAGAHDRLAWLLATCPDSKVRDPHRAVDLARKAIALVPNDGRHWNRLGVALYRSNDWGAAVAALEKSGELPGGKELGSTAFFQAMALWQQGKKEEGRKSYDRAVQWMDQHKPRDEELRRFRMEAAELLGVGKKKD